MFLLILLQEGLTTIRRLYRWTILLPLLSILKKASVLLTVAAWRMWAERYRRIIVFKAFRPTLLFFNFAIVRVKAPSFIRSSSRDAETWIFYYSSNLS